MLEAYKKLLEKEIRKKKFGSQPTSLYEPLRYIMALGGKRLRPLLVLLGYSLFKKDVKKIIPVAVAVEAFHNFTLLHDDIMDKAPLRRGQPTVHEKWSINTAILAGDVMLVKVYEMLLDIDARLLKDVLRKFNTAAAEVCEGQQMDMEFETLSAVSEAQYIKMVRLKTAVLLGFCLELGALLAGAKPGDQKLLREVGINMGIGFQLKDDLLDVYADKAKFGKQVGGDILADKKTYLMIKALQKAGEGHKKNLASWAGTKENPQKKIEGVTRVFDELDVKRMTEKKINRFFDHALSNLNDIRASVEKKNQLRGYIADLIDRQS